MIKNNVASYLIMICLIYFLNDADAEQCNEATAKQCGATLTSYSKMAHVLGEKEINRICGNIQVISKCVRSTECSKQISDDKKNNWAGQRNAFTYLCSDQSIKQTIITSVKAKTPKRKIEEAKCTKSFKVGIKSPKAADPAALCRIINKFIDCTLNTAKSSGMKVTQVYHTFMYKYFTPAAASRNCALKKSVKISFNNNSINQKKMT